MGCGGRGDGQDNPQSYTQGYTQSYSKYSRQPRVRTVHVGTSAVLLVMSCWLAHVIRHRLADHTIGSGRGAHSE